MAPAFVAGPAPPALRASALLPCNALTSRRPARRFLPSRHVLRAQADSTATPSSGTPPPPAPPAAESAAPPPPAADAAADAPPPAPAAAPEAETHVAPTPATSSFLHKYDDLRGKPIEPVSEAMGRFNAAFRRPVPIVYRTIVNELVSTSHLARVCAMWRFDAVFAFGFDAVFTNFLRFYPDEAERTLLFDSAAGALRMDPAMLRDAAASVAAWIDGKTEADVFAALDAAAPGATADAVGPVVEALAYIRDAGEFEWYYSRLFGLGLIQIMAAVGVELTASNAEAWAEKIGMQKSKFAAEMGNYLSSMERLKQAEQIFAEATAREAKKTADRLEEKAKRAAEEAAKLEKGEDTETVAEASDESKEEKKEDSA